MMDRLVLGIGQTRATVFCRMGRSITLCIQPFQCEILRQTKLMKTIFTIRQFSYQFHHQHFCLHPSMLEYSMMDCMFSRYIYPANGSQLYYQLSSVACIHSAGMDISYRFLKLDLHTVFTYLDIESSRKITYFFT